MKKFLFSLLTVAFSFSLVNAQQMSYYTNMVGTPSQSFVIAEDTAADATDLPFNVGTVGAGVIWNFQGLDADLSDTINFFAPNANESLAFPAGNDVIESNVAGRVVFNKDDANGLFLIGTGINVFGNFNALSY